RLIVLSCTEREHRSRPTAEFKFGLFAGWDWGGFACESVSTNPFEYNVYRSVTIPCFYGDGYKTHVKYWCRGRLWYSCPPIVHSDSPQEGKESIRDDPDQRVFTVTMNSLTAGDSGYYSCGVKISGGSDVGDQVYLSVTDGKMSVLQAVANEMDLEIKAGRCCSAPSCFCSCLFLLLPVSAPACFCSCLFLLLPVSALPFAVVSASAHVHLHVCDSL
uniref:Immunoglobulin domain-containing protein n=1 Tax=Paramormyrops kingsleyae TaxID=1676925 RepID=A0A3B3RXI1_9TELE